MLFKHTIKKVQKHGHFWKVHVHPASSFHSLVISLDHTLIVRAGPFQTCWFKIHKFFLLQYLAKSMGSTSLENTDGDGEDDDGAVVGSGACWLGWCWSELDCWGVKWAGGREPYGQPEKCGVQIQFGGGELRARFWRKQYCVHLILRKTSKIPTSLTIAKTVGPPISQWK